MHGSKLDIQLIAKGNTEAFKQLYEDLFPSLASFSVGLVKDKDEASDIVQEALLVYWNKRKRFDAIDDVKAFLYTVIKNLGLNYLRSQKVHIKHLTHIKSNETKYFRDSIIEEETLSIIRAALIDLPNQTKAIVELSMLGTKNADIAERLDISVNTVKTLKLRAYRVLRDKLKDHVFALLFITEFLLK